MTYYSSQFQSVNANNKANFQTCNKSKSSNFKFPTSGAKIAQPEQPSKIDKTNSNIRTQMTALQQLVTKAISSITVAIDMSSAKFGMTGKNGFNSNNIGQQIQKISESLTALISDLSDAAGGDACPAGGKLENMNTEITETADKVMNEPVQMSPEIHNTLLEIRTLLNELMTLMQGKGSFHSQ